MDEDGKSTLERAEYKDGIGILEIDEVEIPGNIEACRDCPVGIIRIQDDGGNEIR